VEGAGLEGEPFVVVGVPTFNEERTIASCEKLRAKFV